MEINLLARKRFRKRFGNIPEILDIPNLIEVQKKSYEEFLQKSVAGDLERIAKELKRGDVSKAYHHLIGNEITVWKVKCLEDVRKELKTSVWKRRITMYKKKR